MNQFTLLYLATIAEHGICEHEHVLFPYKGFAQLVL